MELSVADVHEAIAASRPDEPCLVFRDRRLTWRQLTERTRRLANHLIAAGLGCHTERTELANHESGQDHLAIYLHNGNEYLEAMLGAFKARVAPFNVNYRYVAEELRYLLHDAAATAIVVHSRFSPTLAEVLVDLPLMRVILQVADDSGQPLLPGAIWYEDAVVRASAQRPPVQWSPDDLYILYTGGTTGMPNGVLWRNGDANVECFGGSRAPMLDGAVAEATGRLQALLAPPFMHGAGHWTSFRTWNTGGTVFIQQLPDRLDAADIWSTIEQERVNFLLIVGDAFARPLLDELDRTDYDLSCLTVVLSRRCTAQHRPQTTAPAPPADGDDRRRARLVGGRRPAVQRVGRLRGHDRHVRPQSGQPRAVSVVGPPAAAGRGRARLARQERWPRPRIPRRRRQDGAHLPGDRRGALRRSGRPGDRATGRDCATTARSSCTGAIR